MHPEVRQLGAGACPICGIALEPVLVGAEAGPNHELIDMTRRFWIGLVLTLLEMGGHLTGLTEHLGQQTSNLVQLVSQPRWYYGPAGRSSNEGGARSSAETLTCLH